MLRIMTIVGLGYVWVSYSNAFSVLAFIVAPADYKMMAYQNGPWIFLGLLFLVLAIISSASKGRGKNRWGDGIRNSALVRRITGLVADGILFGAMLGAVIMLVGHFIETDWLVDLVMAAFVWHARRPAKVFIGRSTRPIRRLFGSRHFGMGGTARFSGLLDDWANPWKAGDILLGRSLYDPRWLVGMKDDRHMVTMATTRAGKGRSMIIPNLLTYPGSALVIDPKGQNAAVTALKRGHGGSGLDKPLEQTVHILDPLGEIKDPSLRPFVARFNPLDTLDLKAPDYVERVRNIADALVVPSTNGNDTFWDNAARALIAGLIDYVKISPNVGNDERNLTTVRGLLIHPDGPPVEEMAALGGLAQAGAAGIMTDSPTASSVKFTATVHTDWLDSVAMQKGLSASDFSLGDLNNGNTTIYLVLPPQYIDIHSRFLRLFVNLSLQAATEGRKGRHATLFLLDEFYALGRLQQLAKGAGLLAGFGVKLWPIIQNIGQLQELYPQNWEAFLGNAGMWTVFAMNDASTSRYLSERLGKQILWRKMKGPSGYEWEISGVANLRDALELSKSVSRESSKLVVFTESGDTFLLGRAAYDHVFPRDQYSADPFERHASGLSGLFDRVADVSDGNDAKLAEREAPHKADRPAAQPERPADATGMHMTFDGVMEDESQ